MSEKRRDSKNRILRTGESQEADGRYKYRYIDANGKRKTVYSWRYSEMSDGTWQCDGHIYKYRLEISGRLSNAVKDSTYIYLSNIEDITFEQAWKASGLSSNMDDYFDIDEAVLVELPD